MTFAIMSKRLGTHILFWLAYTLIHAYTNTAFASKSDLAYSIGIRFLRMWGSELMILPIKLGVTYCLFYLLIPNYLLKKRYLHFSIYALLVIIGLLVLYRVDLAYIIYPVLYNEYPGFNSFTFSRFIWSFLDVISATAIFATFKLLKGRFESQQREQELIHQKLKTELQFLKAQTNPHFLFNTLNNLYALARKKSDLTAPAILKLSKLMRFILYECTEAAIPIEKEIQVIEDYVELEKLRYGDRLNVVFQKEMDYPAQPIGPLLLLPFVENAFKHGASESRFETTINIKLQLKDQRLLFEVENAFDGKNQEPSSGLGLKNIKRQLELTYPKNHRLVIEEKEAIFRVFLEIKLAYAQ